MTADDRAAAVILPQRPQLRKEAGGEQAGVAADTVVAQRHDVGRVPAVEIHQLRHAGLPQQGLVRHQKQRGIAVLEDIQPQGDGMTDAPVGVLVFNGCKGKAPCSLRSLRILGDYHYLRKAGGRDCLQCAAQEGLSVHLSGQLIGPKAGRIAGGHDDAADARFFHGMHLRGVVLTVVYPQNGNAVKKYGVISQVG